MSRASPTTVLSRPAGAWRIWWLPQMKADLLASEGHTVRRGRVVGFNTTLARALMACFGLRLTAYARIS